jgi:hypothetical protein
MQRPLKGADEAPVSFSVPIKKVCNTKRSRQKFERDRDKERAEKERGRKQSKNVKYVGITKKSQTAFFIYQLEYLLTYTCN